MSIALKLNLVKVHIILKLRLLSDQQVLIFEETSIVLAGALKKLRDSMLNL